MAKILLVEDNEHNWDMLSRRLKRHGHEIILAFDGEQGVAMAASETPDIVLMDVGLPKIDGHEATRRLRTRYGMTRLPIIALTAHAMAEDRQRALDAGCDDYHAKPIDLSRLLEQMQALLNRDDAADADADENAPDENAADEA